MHFLTVFMHGTRKFHLTTFFSIVIKVNVFLRGLYGPPSRSNWTQGVQLLEKGSVTEFLRKPIATCDSAGRAAGPTSSSRSTHGFLAFISSHLSGCILVSLPLCTMVTLKLYLSILIAIVGACNLHSTMITKLI